MLDKSFQEIQYRINHSINQGSSWLPESLDAEYVNISAFSPLNTLITYIELSRRLRNSMRDLINIKNNDNKGFLGVILDI